MLVAGVAMSGLLCTRDGLSFGRTPLQPCISNCTNPSPPPAGKAQLAASAGFPDDSNLFSCFQRGWQDPGRVRYNGCAGAQAWWDMPVPVKTTGSKSLGVFVKNSGGTSECWADVLGANGTLVRFNVQTFGTIERWVDFASLQVNSNESVEIQCAVRSGNYVSAVRGF
jgi:hypothetical protein